MLDTVDAFQLVSTKLGQLHYADVVKEFDGKSTFHFLDPPHPGHNVQLGESQFDEDEFRDVFKGIKGRFLVTCGARGKLDTSGFSVKKMRTPRTIRSMRGVEGPKALPQLLIANYSITAKALGPWQLEDVDGEVELSAEQAGDLGRAQVLARALADACPAPELAELALQISAVDTGDDARALLLARDLLPVALRLQPALVELIPAAAEAFDQAAPALAELAKANWTTAYVNDLPDDAFLYVMPGGH